MPKGPGRIQRTVKWLFTEHPERPFSAVDIARVAYRNSSPTKEHCKAVRRAADPIADALGWTRRRVRGRVQYVRADIANAMHAQALARMRSVTA